MLTRENQRTPFDWVLEKHLVGLQLGQHNIAAICSLRHDRQRKAVKLVPCRRECAGFEAEMLGGAKKLRMGQNLRRLSKLMT